MQRLRVLSPLLIGAFGALAVLAALGAATTTARAQADSAAEAADSAPPARPEKMNVGDVLDFPEPLEQVFPSRGEVSLTPRKGRPLVLLFWGRSSALGREAVLELDAFRSEEKLLAGVDVFAVGPFKSDKMKAEDLREMAIIDGVKGLPILGDPDMQLSRLVGASQYPEIAIFDKTGKLLVRGIRGLDHDRLGVERKQTAAELLRELAVGGGFPPIQRAFPSYPADRLVGRKYPDFEAPRFDARGYGKGLNERLGALLTGQRPGVIMFFSSTCKHCQVDVPQLVTFLKKHPDLYDVVGVTRIKDERHRKISESYFKSQGLDIPILEDVGQVSEAYRVSSTPTTYYLSPAGRITKITYYQHQDLEKDYLDLHPKLLGAPPPAPIRADRGWHFPLQVTSPAGQPVALKSLEGRPTILHFWATWCVPCREELPQVVRRLPELQQRANVLLVSVDEEPAKVALYQEKTGLRFESYHSPAQGFAEDINFARSVPRTYVLDEHGRVGRILAGAYDWDDDDQYAAILGRLSRSGS